MADKQKIKYSKIGEDYNLKDPVKKLALKSAAKTSKNIFPFTEISQSRGESAYVWKQGKVLMASVIECLGTKNVIADEMKRLTGKDYYQNIAHDTIATIVNDLITVGARPITLHAFWAIGHVNWLKDRERIANLIKGWKKACDLSGASWGGGESPTLRGVVDENNIVLGGSCVGIVGDKRRLITEEKMKTGDRIILLKSNGPNANALSLVRAVSKKLPKGYLTKLKNGKTFGEEVLNKTNIYSKVITDLLDSGIKISYISNLTGHGMRKIMRARNNFSYVIEKIFEPQEVFKLIQETAKLSDKEMYGTFNMGMDYAIFMPSKFVEKTLKIIRENGFKAIDAGFVAEGERQVIIKPKKIIYSSDSLNLK